MSMTFLAIYAAAATFTSAPQVIRAASALPRAVVSVNNCVHSGKIAMPGRARNTVLANVKNCAGLPTTPGTVDGQTAADEFGRVRYKWSALRQKWESVDMTGMSNGSGMGGVARGGFGGGGMGTAGGLGLGLAGGAAIGRATAPQNNQASISPR